AGGPLPEVPENGRGDGDRVHSLQFGVEAGDLRELVDRDAKAFVGQDLLDLREVLDLLLLVRLHVQLVAEAVDLVVGDTTEVVDRTRGEVRAGFGDGGRGGLPAEERGVVLA